MAQYENKGKSTQDAGYQVKQIGEADMDDSWRRGETSRAVDLDNSAELHEDEKLREAHQKIKAIMEMDDGGDMYGTVSPKQQQQPARRGGGGLSMNDLSDGISREDMARAMGGMEDAAGNVARDLVNDGMQQSTPNESAMMAESYGNEPRNTNGAWGVEKMRAKLKNGKHVPVWKVIDESTGMEIPNAFRIQEPAQRIASIINKTGNVNDPRIKGIMEAYKQHIQLMKQVRQLKHAITEGRGDLKPKLREVYDALEETNFKLGI